MSAFSEFRMIDILSHVDISALESEVPDQDLSNPKLAARAGKQGSEKKRLAIISGIAAGSVMLTGAILLACRKHMKYAA